jgi:glycosyltransferase involved in cell wall biosynthesis
MPRILAFPRRGIAYTECLYDALEALGGEVVEGEWSGKHLLAALRAGDVIHVHWPSFLYHDQRSLLRTLLNMARVWIVFLLARAKGARIVWTAHNLYPHDGGRHFWPHRVMRRYFARIASRIFVHGPTAQQILQSEFAIPDERLTQIPHGHWIDRYPRTMTRDEARARLQLPKSGYVFGFIGACMPYKNIEMLVRAYGRLPEGGHMLVVAGLFKSEEYLAKIRRVVADHGQGRVRFEPRFLDDRELAIYLSAIDALILPYVDALTSGSAFLALSFGRPFVAPNVGGLRDVIDSQCGQLYGPNDEDALVGALQDVSRRTFDEDAIIARARRAEWRLAAEPLLAEIRAELRAAPSTRPVSHSPPPQ